MNASVGAASSRQSGPAGPLPGVPRLVPDVRGRGLTGEEAARQLIEQGPNEIRREPEQSSWILLARQFNSPVIWLLIGACAVSVALGEAADAVAIISIVVLNGGSGSSRSAVPNVRSAPVMMRARRVERAHGRPSRGRVRHRRRRSAAVGAATSFRRTQAPAQSTTNGALRERAAHSPPRPRPPAPRHLNLRLGYGNRDQNGTGAAEVVR